MNYLVTRNYQLYLLNLHQIVLEVNTKIELRCKKSFQHPDSATFMTARTNTSFCFEPGGIEVNSIVDAFRFQHRKSFLLFFEGSPRDDDIIMAGVHAVIVTETDDAVDIVGIDDLTT